MHQNRKSVGAGSWRVLPFLLGFIHLGAGSALAATYYVSAATGNDITNNGLSTSAPWKTINHAAQNMMPGDTCNIMAGTYRETATVGHSGTAMAPITFQPYNTDVPVIKGEDVVTGTWTADSTQANTYYIPATLTLDKSNLDRGNQVFVNDQMQSEARYPKHGSLYPWQDSSVNPSSDWHYVDTAGYDAGTGQNGWITDTALPAHPDDYWTNCVVNIMSGYGWVMYFPNVIHSSGTKLYTDDAHGLSTAYAMRKGNEFYLTNKKFLLSANNEWFYDSAALRLYMYSDTGAAPSGTIEVKQRSYGFDLSGKSYITLNGLHFFGCTIKTDSGSTYCTFNGLTMKYTNHNARSTQVSALSLYTGDVLRNSDLSFDSAGLVNLAGANIRVINNNLHDSGYTPYLTAALQGTGAAANNLISHNTVYNTARAAVGFVGRASIVEYNDLHDATLLCSDAGIFYTFGDAVNTVIRYNLMHDSQGPAGHAGNSVQGLYLDAESSNWIIHHNVIWSVAGASMQLNCRQAFLQVFNNTTWDADSIYTAFPSDGESGSHIFNNIFTGTPIGADWSYSDLQHNITTANPLYGNPATNNFALQSASPAIDAGSIAPGITDGFTGPAPDMGAIEYGTADWTSLCGYTTTPPVPDPVYTFSTPALANILVNGGLESGAFAPNWTATGSVAMYTNANSSWLDYNLDGGYYAAKFPGGTAEMSQTVTNLQPNHYYTFYTGVDATRVSGTPTITLGVRNFGGTTVTNGVTPTTNAVPPTIENWQMGRVSFLTGITNTSAQVYLDVTVPSGAVPVYADNFGLVAAQTPDVLNDQAVGGTATASADHPPSETAPMAFDGTSTTKWFAQISGSAAWLRYQFAGGAAWQVVQYQITSANDTPARDPRDWQFQGSQDGTTWTTLDARAGEVFASRYQTVGYPISNDIAYKYYRLNVLSNAGGTPVGVQLAQLSLLVPSLAPWVTTDIGNPVLPGSAIVSHGQFGAAGSGADIWGTADQFRYVYQPMAGNCDVRCRVLSLSGADAWAKAGIMIRATLDPGSPHAFLQLTPGNGCQFSRRLVAGGASVQSGPGGTPLAPPYWLRLTRSGSTFTAYTSPDGATWTSQGTATITMGNNVVAGFAVTSHDNTTTNTALFDNFTGP